MRLNRLEAEESVLSHSYELSGPSAVGRTLPHALRVRALSRDRKTSVLYYFGERGLEIDIQVEPGERVSKVGLESLDADLSMNATGQLLAGDHPLWLKPVAYTVDARGRRHAISAHYRASDRRLSFEIARYDRADRLVIDPVITYATYFGGSGDNSPIAIWEMPDGSVLFGGNTASIDLPHGVSLNGPSMVPGANSRNQCYVANISPAKKEINFVSYFVNTCSSMDVDSSGRILLAGYAGVSTAFTTPGAQYPGATSQNDGYLARISADGRTLEYATYLGLGLAEVGLLMRAGPGDTAYIALSGFTPITGGPNIPGGYEQKPGPGALLRYNIAAKAFDEQTYFDVAPSGLTVSPAGTVFLYGSTNGVAKLPLQNPIQSAPPNGGVAGFVAEFSADLHSLLVSSYLGGQGSSAQINSVRANADGSLWLTGFAADGSIPGLRPARPPVTLPSFFALRVIPGHHNFSSAFYAGDGYGMNNTLDLARTILLQDGRVCVSASGYSPQATPGTVVPPHFTPPTAYKVGASPPTPMFGCLNANGDDFALLTLAMSELVAASKNGGIWSLSFGSSSNPASDAVPYDFKSAAIQPYSALSGDPVLYYIDLTYPKPVLLNPQPVRLMAVQNYFTDSVDLIGRNFSLDMQLEINGQQVPLDTRFPTASNLNYASTLNATPGQIVPTPGQTVLNLHAGSYTGRLSVPTQPQPIVSDSFSVIVSNLAPQPQPFLATSNRLTFVIQPPVYDDSIVTWNGQNLPIQYATDGTALVQIPATLAQGSTGEFVLTNQRPGGGVERQTVLLISGAASSVKHSEAQPTRITADLFQVDTSRKLLYTVANTSQSSWTLASYSLPSGSPINSVQVAKNGASLDIDLRLSVDGSLLYLTDDTLRIMRFQAATLQQNLQFNISNDQQPEPAVATQYLSLRVLDTAESLLVVTPAGRMIIYDGDQARPYTTTDFPSPDIIAMDPVLATGAYVYALEQAPAYTGLQYLPEMACLVRYPVDGLGFGPAEDFCNPGANWGKYPEMKIYNGNLVLQNDREAHAIRFQTDLYQQMRLPFEYNVPQNIEIIPLLVFVPVPAYRLLFNRTDDGEPIGHYPSQSVLGPAIVSALILNDNTLIYFQQITQSPMGQSGVYIVPNWRSVSEIYP